MRYLVKVAMTFHKEITVFAPDEETAKDKAEEIVSGWANVYDCEALEAEEDE